MGDFYDRQGEPIGMFDWAGKISDRAYQRVAQETVNQLWVSTVWLGIDHGFGKTAQPLIFETMVFPMVGNKPLTGRELLQWRHSTEADAVCNHQRIVDALKAHPALTISDATALLENMRPTWGGDVAANL